VVAQINEHCRVTKGDRTGTERQRRFRERQREGAKRIRLDLTRAFIEFMLAEKWIGETELMTADAIEAAVSDLLECLAEGRLTSRYATLRTAETLDANREDRE
jgi:hypothetical protein